MKLSMKSTILPGNEITRHEQLSAMRKALLLLDLGHYSQAEVDLGDALKQTPVGSDCYHEMLAVCTALNEGFPRKATGLLADALLRLEHVQEVQS